MKKIALQMKNALAKAFENLPKYSLLIVALAVISQFAGYTSILSEYKDHRAVIEARDNDAGEMIKVAGRTTWYNDNSFRYYGPLYFRLASSMNAFAPVSDFYLNGHQGPEVREISLHFHLILLSLLAVFAVALIAAWNVVDGWALRLSLTSLLVWALTLNPKWSKYLLTAHPDMLLGAMAALAMLGTYFVLRGQFSDKSLRWAGAGWGLALSTKLSSLFLTPGVFFMFFPPFAKERWGKFKILFHWILITYFLVGFPQNFDIFGSLRKLLKLSEYSVAFSWQEFAYWYELFFGMIWRPALVLVVFWFFLGTKKRVLTSKQVWRFFLLANLGMVLLSTRTILLTHDHYVIPFAAVGLLSWSVLIAHYLPFEIIKREPLKHLLAIGALFVVGKTVGLVSSQTVETANTLYSCRSEHREVFNKSLAYVKKGMIIHATPYTPVTQNSDLVGIDWEMTWERIKEENAQVIVISQPYYLRFTQNTEPTPYVQKNNPEWQKQRDLFMSLDGDEAIASAEFGSWKRVRRDSCGLSIWEKVQN